MTYDIGHYRMNEKQINDQIVYFGKYIIDHI